jgi:uncharacterized protein YdaU (DUF1376 family)
MAKKTDTWMPIYIGDYLADTGHLTTTQHGAYLLLLMHYWRKRELPADDKQLSAIAKLPLRIWLDTKETIQAFFHDGWKHKRLEEEIQRRVEVSEKRAAAGSEGGKSRGKKEANASVLLEQNPSMLQSHIQEEEKRKKETRVNALADDWPADYRERFWVRFPNKIGRPKALAKLDNCRKRGVSFNAIMSGLDRYIAAKPPDRAWLNPETFINQERWTDQPATIEQQNGQRTSNSRTTGHDAILAAATREAGKIARDDELAGAAPEAQFPFGDFSDRDRAGVDRRPPAIAAGNHDRREPAAGRVFEGEIIAPDQAPPRVSNGWRGH